MDLLRSELQILEHVVVQPKDLLGTVLAVLITVQEMHTVLVLTEGETAAEFLLHVGQGERDTASHVFGKYEGRREREGEWCLQYLFSD